MKIDSVIFDIDGVLIDVSRSFRMVIAMVVADYLKTFEGYFGPPIITPEATQVFKDRGGFNNDWELTEAAILLSLSLKNQFQRFTPVKDLPGWYGGGGLNELYERIETSKLNRNWIHERFKILYAGKKYCQRLYGFEPVEEIVGMVEKERVILKRELLSGDFDYGIVTGRTEEETLLALEKIELEPSFFKTGILWEITKPDPEPMERLSFKSGVYIGDTVDDLEMARRFRSKEKRLSFIFVKPPFKKDINWGLEDVLFFADDVNSALRWLVSRDRGEWT